MRDPRKFYYGRRTVEGVCEIQCGLISGLGVSKPAVLDITRSQALMNHSGVFDWGSQDARAMAQTGLAILLDFTDMADVALQHYVNFVCELVILLPRDGWTLIGDEIELWFKNRDLAKEIFSRKYAEPDLVSDIGDGADNADAFFSE
jgi:uncharacterized protein DUF6166